MAEQKRFIDTDVAGGLGDGSSLANAYATLSACEAAEQGDFDTANDTALWECYATSGTADSSVSTIDGSVTSATDYIQVEASAADRANLDGLDTAKYRKDMATANGITVSDDNVRLVGLQIDGGTSGHGIALSNSAATTKVIHIDSCLITTASSVHDGINVNMFGGTETVFIFNNVIYDTGDNGIQISDANATNIYNNTFVDCGDHGIATSAGTVTLINNLFFSNTTGDVTGTITSTYCATDVAAVSSGLDGGTGDIFEVSDPFVNFGANDFNLGSGTDPVEAGVDDPGSGLYSDDMDSTARSSTWDIGAGEFVAAAGGIVVLRRRRS